MIPQKACPGLDPGWVPVFGKDHAPRKSKAGAVIRARPRGCPPSAPAGCPPALRCAPCGLRQLVLAPAARARVLLDHRHRIGAGEPAVQIDVGAALRAERAKARQRRLAAERAAPGGTGYRLIHGRDVGAAAGNWKGCHRLTRPALRGAGTNARFYLEKGHTVLVCSRIL